MSSGSIERELDEWVIELTLYATNCTEKDEE